MLLAAPEHWFLPEHWPEIVQAFSAVVALFLSIYIPVRIRNLDRAAARDEQFQQAKALAYFILADLFAIYEKAVYAIVFLEYDHKKEAFTAQAVRDELLMESAEKLLSKADKFWMFGFECGELVNRAVSEALYLNEKVRKGLKGEQITVDELRRFAAIYRDSFVKARDNANQAVTLLNKQYDLKQ
jgi:hypothetical protein